MRLLIAPALLLSLVGCAQTDTPVLPSQLAEQGFTLSVEGVRAGASAAEIASSTSNISGRSYRFSMGPFREDLKVEMVIEAGELEDGLVPVEANAEIEFEGTQAEFESVINHLKTQKRFESFRVDGLTIFIEGNGLMTPDGKGVELFAFDRTGIFDPHDCFAVEGLCRFKSYSNNETRAAYIVKAIEIDGIWRAIKKFDPKNDPERRSHIASEYVYSVDSAGMAMDWKRQKYLADGKKKISTMKRLGN